MRSLTIAIDFDGTIVSSRYPEIGIKRIGADIINIWHENHTIIINSCRTGIFQMEMRNWLDANNIRYHYINENSQQLIDRYRMDSRKVSADIYFDDKNAGGFKGFKWAHKKVCDLSARRPLIICIVGESGSGKTTLANRIEYEWGIPMILSYTDRPRRKEDDTDHVYVSKLEYDTLEGEVIASTTFGGYRYCCLHKDVRDFNTYVIDESGLVYLQCKHGDMYDIRTIRLTCPEEERIERVGPERVKRDIGKFNLPLSYYDVIIRTNLTYDLEAIHEILNV